VCLCPVRRLFDPREHFLGARLPDKPIMEDGGPPATDLPSDALGRPRAVEVVSMSKSKKRRLRDRRVAVRRSKVATAEVNRLLGRSCTSCNLPSSPATTDIIGILETKLDAFIAAIDIRLRHVECSRWPSLCSSAPEFIPLAHRGVPAHVLHQQCRAACVVQTFWRKYCARKARADQPGSNCFKDFDEMPGHSHTICKWEKLLLKVPASSGNCKLSPVMFQCLHSWRNYVLDDERTDKHDAVEGLDVCLACSTLIDSNQWCFTSDFERDELHTVFGIEASPGTIRTSYLCTQCADVIDPIHSMSDHANVPSEADVERISADDKKQAHMQSMLQKRIDMMITLAENHVANWPADLRSLLMDTIHRNLAWLEGHHAADELHKRIDQIDELMKSIVDKAEASI